jgi:hypothetical protein
MSNSTYVYWDKRLCSSTARSFLLPSSRNAQPHCGRSCANLQMSAGPASECGEKSPVFPPNIFLHRHLVQREMTLNVEISR